MYPLNGTNAHKITNYYISTRQEKIPVFFFPEAHIKTGRNPPPG